VNVKWQAGGNPLFLVVLMALALAGCATADRGSQRQPAENGTGQAPDQESEAELAPLVLPELDPASLSGEERLQVVATNSIIGDVVAQVGGDATALTTLMGPGQDPHSYQPSTGDLTRVARADVIFVNGYRLEEGLLDDLANVAPDVPLVPVSAAIEPLPFGGHEGDEDEGDRAVDPHTWLDPRLVEQWVHNIERALQDLDPARGEIYQANARAYLAQLAELIAYADEQMARLPEDRRKLVTNHDALTYFARRYDLEIIGSVIPSASTLSEPSARHLAQLVQKMEEEGVCTIFTETTVSSQLATAATAELDKCDEVRVLPLYSGALGPAGSEADSYIGMMRTNVDTIVTGLSN
jgi:zinc/manganese transport system substrate-binding protein/manganese/iron transport system substrate-binding protein